MARSDTATLVIGGGRFYTAPVGTAFPEDPNAPGVEWKELGHTSAEDIFGINSEGGETTTLATLQNRELRTKRSPRSESFRINLVQWDESALQLYFGANAEVDDLTGLMDVPSDPVPVEGAFLAVLTDGGRQFCIHALKTELSRGDNIELADMESLAMLPVDIKPLIHQTRSSAWSLTPLV